jgi:hypothetical protein
MNFRALMLPVTDDFDRTVLSSNGVARAVKNHSQSRFVQGDRKLSVSKGRGLILLEHLRYALHTLCAIFPGTRRLSTEAIAAPLGFKSRLWSQAKHSTLVTNIYSGFHCILPYLMISNRLRFLLRLTETDTGGLQHEVSRFLQLAHQKGQYQYVRPY